MGTQGEYDAQELLDVLDFGPRKGRPSIELDFVVERELTEEDIPIIQEKAPDGAPGQFNRLSAVKFKHHQIARLVAAGHSAIDVSAITGYTPTYIENLSNKDPMFRELVHHYLNLGEIAREDALARMNALNVTAMEELQKRLDDAPEDWSNRELMDLSDQMSKPLIAKVSQQRPIGLNGAEGGVNISVNFVAPKEQKPVVDIDVVDVKSEDI